MSEIKEKIEEVTQLLEQLKIIQQEENYFTINEPLEEEFENEEIIYDYESDEVLEPVFNNFEEGKTSNRKRTYDYVKEENVFGPDYQRYKFRRGYTTSGKSIPKEYTPVYKNKNEQILNIDCVENAQEIYKIWIKTIGLELQVNSALRTLSNEELWNYVLFNTSGTVSDYLEGFSQTDKETVYNNGQTNYDKFAFLAQAIYGEFFGSNIIYNKQQVELENAEKARIHLNNIRICDDCQLDKFICEYRKYYYQLPITERENYTNIFLYKLPSPLSEDTIKRFNLEKENRVLADTLGGAIQALKNVIHDECSRRKHSKTFGRISRICSKKSDPEIPGEYGCRKNPYKKIKTRHFEKPSRTFPPRKWKKKKYFPKKTSWKSKRFFKKKKELDSKSKYCPSKKKDCRCWFCHEDGHYANKCSKKKNLRIKK